MKSILTLLVAVLCAVNAQAITHVTTWQTAVGDAPELTALHATGEAFDGQAFLDLTPKKFRDMTGERLGIKGTLALKAAQKAYKKQLKQGSNRASDIPKGLYIVGAIFGFAWLLMGIMDDFEGNNWWVNLLLLFVTCGIGALIHAFIKMDEYY